MEALQRLHNRGSISTAAYEIDNSVCWEPDLADQAYRSQGSTAGTRTKQTFSVWLKRSELGGDQYIFEGGTGNANDTQFGIQFSNSNKIQVMRAHTGSGYQYLLNTNRLFRDTSAWYHIVVAVDTTLSTADNRVRLYVNGVEETSFANRNNPSQNDNLGTFAANAQTSLGVSANLGKHLAAYMAEPCLIYNAQLAPTSFGEFDDDTGIWKPKDLSGLTFGTYGYWLEFKTNNTVGDAAGLGHDSSGNDNDFSRFDSTIKATTDTPTNNFCTLNFNVNFKYGTNAGGMINGATTFGDDTGGGVGGAFGTMAVTAGKWYWEVKLTDTVSHYIGVSAVDDGDNVTSGTAASDPHQQNSTFRFNISAARIEYLNNGSNTNGSLDAFSDFHTAGDIIGIALNMDDNQISIYGNGTLQSGVANTSIYDAADKMVVPFHGTINDECQYNFGGFSEWTPSSAASDANGYGTFEYAPPSGYYALCTKNLEEYG